MTNIPTLPPGLKITDLEYAYVRLKGAPQLKTSVVSVKLIFTPKTLMSAITEVASRFGTIKRIDFPFDQVLPITEQELVTANQEGRLIL